METAGPRILIVEDNALIVALLRQSLEDRFELEVAVNGKLGVEAALAAPPDLILMDLTMPVMDGWTAIRLLRASATTAAVPILVMSGLTGADVARARTAGADGHVTKPFDDAALEAEIARLLALREGRPSGVRATRAEIAAQLSAARDAERGRR